MEAVAMRADIDERIGFLRIRRVRREADLLITAEGGVDKWYDV